MTTKPDESISVDERQINLQELMKDFRRYYSEFDEEFNKAQDLTTGGAPTPCFVSFGISGAGKVCSNWPHSTIATQCPLSLFLSCLCACVFHSNNPSPMISLTQSFLSFNDQRIHPGTVDNDCPSS